MIDPIVWMQAAVIQLSEGKVAEAEMVWSRVQENVEDTLTITVRRKPWQPIAAAVGVEAPDEDDEGD